MCPAVDEGVDMPRQELGHAWGCATLDEDAGMHYLLSSAELKLGCLR